VAASAEHKKDAFESLGSEVLFACISESPNQPISRSNAMAASAADEEHEKDVFAILGFTASPLYRYALIAARAGVCA
jgi:hypothetical protein